MHSHASTLNLLLRQANSYRFQKVVCSAGYNLERFMVVLKFPKHASIPIYATSASSFCRFARRELGSGGAKTLLFCLFPTQVQ